MFKVVSTERHHLLLVGFLELTNNKHSNKKQYFISHRYMKRSIVQGRQLQLHKYTYFFKIAIAA
jgi:hypothetical protein